MGKSILESMALMRSSPNSLAFADFLDTAIDFIYCI